MINNSKFCKKVITIPQYEPTCWFNVILMAILYSQYSRKLLLDDEILAKKNTKIAKIIKHILKYQYVSNKYAELYFNLMTPGKILRYFHLDYEFRDNITNNGWFPEFFLPLFIEKACYKSYLNLDLLHNNIYIEFKKIIKIINTFVNGKFDGAIITTKDASYSDLETHIDKKLYEPNPDYIFLNVGHETSKSAYSSVLNKSSIYFHMYPKINLNNHNIKTKGLYETEEIIYYNNDTYILDSCIIGNYNDLSVAHAIVGISCKNNKYVYNGWIRSTKDPAMLFNKNNDYEKDDKLLPCELMKFDWNANDKDKKFCLNPNLCKLDIIKSQNDSNENNKLCFSFGIENRTLIYVKQPKTKIKSIDSNFIKTNPSTITLPTISTNPEDIFVDIKDKKNDIKKNIYKTLKLKLKTVKNKKDLIRKLKELRIKEKEIIKEIEALKK
jgi:hypothetical protein